MSQTGFMFFERDSFTPDGSYVSLDRDDRSKRYHSIFEKDNIRSFEELRKDKPAFDRWIAEFQLRLIDLYEII